MLQTERQLKFTAMKFYWSMPDTLKAHYKRELVIYQNEFSKGNLQVAWRHLERAHILGQPWPKEHTHVHWTMLLFGIRIKNAREIFGQIPRLLVGGVKSFCRTHSRRKHGRG